MFKIHIDIWSNTGKTSHYVFFYFLFLFIFVALYSTKLQGSFRKACWMKKYSINFEVHGSADQAAVKSAAAGQRKVNYN